MTQLDQWILGDYIKEAMTSGSSMSAGNSMAGGLFRGGILGGKGGLPVALVRGARAAKTLSSAFTPQRPFSVAPLSRTIRILGMKSQAGGGLREQTINNLNARAGIMPTKK
jgi:hypothetical protein